jgi:alpha-beta hydrolase superfamily lysophospholipase
VNTITVQYPDESIILAGHSAGGLAARAALVRHDLKNANRLVSIASPHMGTDMAGLGMAFTTGKMKFNVGDYFAMIKDPRMAMPFIKSFSVMGGV